MLTIPTFEIDFETRGTMNGVSLHFFVTELVPKALRCLRTAASIADTLFQNETVSVNSR
jgi:hypothetical protein